MGQHTLAGETSSSSTAAGFCLAIVAFTIPGWIMSVNVQLARYHDMDDMGLVTFAYALGSFGTILFDKDALGRDRMKSQFLVGTGDAFGNCVFAIALMWAGSMYHTVIYSSLPIFVAILRWLVLGDKLSVLKCMAIGTIVFGLTWIVRSAREDRQHVDAQNRVDSKLMVGIVLSFVCVAVNTVYYIVSEWVQKNSVSKPSDVQLTWAGGASGMVVGGVSVLMNHEEVLLKMTKLSSADVVVVLALYASMALANGTHMVSFYWLMRNTTDGSVLVGVLQGARTVITLLHGAIFLCPYQQSQCMTMSKTLAVMVITSGVMAFLFGGKIEETIGNYTRQKQTGERSALTRRQHHKSYVQNDV